MVAERRTAVEAEQRQAELTVRLATAKSALSKLQRQAAVSQPAVPLRGASSRSK